MNNIISLIALSLFFNCNYFSEPKSTFQKQNFNSPKCIEIIKCGDTDLCLPEIDGLTECYKNPLVKPKADEYTYPGNSILAFYVNDSTYNQVLRHQEVAFQDCFKVYLIDKMKGLKIGQIELDQLAQTFENANSKYDWNKLITEIEKKIDSLSIGKPVLLKSYSPSNQIRTFVFLTKKTVKENEYITLMTMNLILVKERLVLISYYKNYLGTESVNKVIAKNDYIVLRFLDENK
jgi:hypothetical protein